MALVISSKVRTRERSESLLSHPASSHGQRPSMKRVRNPGSAFIQRHNSAPRQEPEYLFEQYLTDMQDQGHGASAKPLKTPHPLDSAGRSISSVPFVPNKGLFLASASSPVRRVQAKPDPLALSNSDRSPSSVLVRNAALGRLNKEAVYSALDMDARKDASRFSRYHVPHEPSLTLLAQANTQYRTALRLLMS